MPPLLPPAVDDPPDEEDDDDEPEDPNVRWLLSTLVPELLNTFLISDPPELLLLPVLMLVALLVLLYRVLV